MQGLESSGDNILDLLSRSGLQDREAEMDIEPRPVLVEDFKSSTPEDSIPEPATWRI
jgi:hypothetical protein